MSVIVTEKLTYLVLNTIREANDVYGQIREN